VSAPSPVDFKRVYSFYVFPQRNICERTSIGAGTLRWAASWVAFTTVLGRRAWVSIPTVIAELSPTIADVVATAAIIVCTTALTEAHFVGEK